MCSKFMMYREDDGANPTRVVGLDGTHGYPVMCAGSWWLPQESIRKHYFCVILCFLSFSRFYRSKFESNFYVCHLNSINKGFGVHYSSIVGLIKPFSIVVGYFTSVCVIVLL